MSISTKPSKETFAILTAVFNFSAFLTIISVASTIPYPVMVDGMSIKFVNDISISEEPSNSVFAIFTGVLNLLALVEISIIP